MSAYLNIPLSKSSYHKIVSNNEDFLVKNLPTFDVTEKMYLHHLIQETFLLNILDIEPSPVIVEKNKEILQLIYDKNIGEFFQFYDILINLNDKTCGNLLKVKLIDIHHRHHQNNHIRELNYSPTIKVSDNALPSSHSFKCLAKISEVDIPSFSSTTINYSKTRVYVSGGDCSGLELQIAANPSSEMRNIKVEFVPVIPLTPASFAVASLGIKLSTKSKMDSPLREAIQVRFQLPDYYCINKENRMVRQSLLIVGHNYYRKGTVEFVESRQESRLNRHDNGMVSCQVQATALGVICCFWELPQFMLDAARVGPKFYYPYFIQQVDCIVAIKPWNNMCNMQGFNLLIAIYNRHMDISAKLKEYQVVGSSTKISICCGKFQVKAIGNFIPHSRLFWLESLEKIIYFSGSCTYVKLACTFESSEFTHLEGKVTISYLGLPDNFEDADPRQARPVLCDKLQTDIVIDLKSDHGSITSTLSSRVEIGMLRKELEACHAHCLLIESLIENIGDLNQLHVILSNNDIKDDGINLLEVGKARLLLHTKQETVERIYDPLLNQMDQLIKMQNDIFEKLKFCHNGVEDIVNFLPPQIAEYLAAYFPNYSRGMLYLQKQLTNDDNCTIFITGDENAGKSTLINFFLGKEILTTNNVKSHHSYEFRYSDDIAVDIVINRLATNDREIVRRRNLGNDLSTFLAEQVVGDTNMTDKKIFRIYYPSIFLKTGVTIIEDSFITDGESVHAETATLITGAVAVIYVIDAGIQVREQVDKIAKSLAIIRDKTSDIIGFPASSIMFVCNKLDSVELDDRPNLNLFTTQQIKDVWPQCDEWQIVWTSFKNGLQHFKAGFVAEDMKNFLHHLQKQLSTCIWFRFIIHIRHLERILRTVQIPYKFQLKNCSLPINQLRSHLRTIKQAQVKISEHLEKANENVDQALEDLYKAWSAELTESLHKMIESEEFESEMSMWSKNSMTSCQHSDETVAKKLLKDRIAYLLTKWENISCIFVDMEFETERIIEKQFDFPALSRGRGNKLLPLVGPLFLSKRSNLIFPKMAAPLLNDKDGLSAIKLAIKPRINCESVEALMTSLIDNLRIPTLNSSLSQSLISLRSSNGILTPRKKGNSKNILCVLAKQAIDRLRKQQYHYKIIAHLMITFRNDVAKFEEQNVIQLSACKTILDEANRVCRNNSAQLTDRLDAVHKIQEELHLLHRTYDHLLK